MFIKVCLLIALATAVMSLPTEAPKKHELTVDEHWADFKTNNNRKYDTPEEEARRFEIFKENLKGILEHNKKYDAGESTYKQGVNNFTDLTQEEFATQYLMEVPDDKPGLVGSH